MATVESILKNKGKAVYSVEPDAMILDAVKIMAEKNIGAVLVMTHDKVLGIFSERDYVRRGTVLGKSSNSPVKEVMTDKVYYVSPEESVEVCMAQMTDKHIRHLPVVKNGKVVGVISIGDVVKSIISDKDTLIKGLENYLLGRDIKQ